MATVFSLSLFGRADSTPLNPSQVPPGWCLTSIHDHLCGVKIEGTPGTYTTSVVTQAPYLYSHNACLLLINEVYLRTTIEE
jgi:hypothetical protein